MSHTISDEIRDKIPYILLQNNRVTAALYVDLIKAKMILNTCACAFILVLLALGLFLMTNKESVWYEQVMLGALCAFYVLMLWKEVKKFFSGLKFLKDPILRKNLVDIIPAEDLAKDVKDVLDALSD